MVRIKASVTRKRGRKRLFKLTKGHYGQRKNRQGQASRSAIRALKFNFIHRKKRARDFRRLWVIRINAACQEQGMAYSRFVKGLKEAKVALDRKMLAEIAFSAPETFAKLVEVANKALPPKVTRRKVAAKN